MNKGDARPRARAQTLRTRPGIEPGLGEPPRAIVTMTAILDAAVSVETPVKLVVRGNSCSGGRPSGA